MFAKISSASQDAKETFRYFDNMSIMLPVLFPLRGQFEEVMINTSTRAARLGFGSPNEPVSMFSAGTPAWIAFCGHLFKRPLAQSQRKDY